MRYLHTVSGRREGDRRGAGEGWELNENAQQRDETGRDGMDTENGGSG